MRFRPVHLFLLVFQALFLNVVVPGHERGIVQLAGSPCESCQSSRPAPRSCCTNRTDSTRQPADPDRPSHCAVCSFAANLCIPPVFHLTPQALGLLEVCDPPAPHIAPSAGLQLRQRSRAPPVIA
jgi:hypothetical protein